MNKQYSAMRSNVTMLGKLLGDTIKDALGEEMLAKVEHIRLLSKSARSGNKADRQALISTLQSLSDDELLPVAKAFNQFLNLTNTAEQYQNTLSNDGGHSTLTQLFTKLKEQQIASETIKQAIDQLSIELVLTAHPTEINRRTMINQLAEVSSCLEQMDNNTLSTYSRQRIMRRLRQLVAQGWYTDEIRKMRPTPIDEAKWGFSVVENSLWQGVPAFLREFNDQLTHILDYQPPVELVPIRFSSWMGGDRDGNPNVTAAITRKVMLLARIKAAELFSQDIHVLINELSISLATDELYQLAGDKEANEPYRVILRRLRKQLQNTIHYLTAQLQEQEELIPADLLIDNDQLWQPLFACYQSLKACGMSVIANGQLLDTLRRVRCFGLPLIRLDIRQDSARHTSALSELTRYLGLGDYAEWSESDKQAFLIKELNSRRPLVPHHWQASPETLEVFATCRVIAESPKESIATYIISMAQAPSDILAVHLLLKEVDCPHVIPVVPLFETLDDLNNASQVMMQLFSIEWYRGFIQGKQMIMIGYSDSAKDAGILAASWAQYKAQEALIKLCQQFDIALTLFHGRGGSNGRGGLPAHAALLAQPPGSLKHGLRVTEQGEIIRFKLGLPQITINSLMLYASAILEANLIPPPNPKQNWRNMMEELSAVSCQAYRQVIRDNSDFIDYFRSATPEQELAKLPLGSRPAKRRSNGGIESLRAIPWIFAWTQNRLILPAWLGAGQALQQQVKQGHQKLLEAMYHEWPFFAVLLGMLEMVYAKTDRKLAALYDHYLVEPRLWPLGEELRQQLQHDITTVLNITHGKQLMQNLPLIAESINLRNIYTDPLNMLQVELLRRSRQQYSVDSRVEQPLMVTIAGIAAGMRNTG